MFFITYKAIAFFSQLINFQFSKMKTWVEVMAAQQHEFTEHHRTAQLTRVK